MAYANTNSGLKNGREASNGLFDRFASLFSTVKLAAQRRRIYSQTLRELNDLTDRDLADLGINRLSISDIAREASYTK